MNWNRYGCIDYYDAQVRVAECDVISAAKEFHASSSREREEAANKIASTLHQLDSATCARNEFLAK